MTKEPIWKQAWRPAAAAVYLTICMFDFVIMPSVYSNSYKPSELVEHALRFSDPVSQIKALETMDKTQGWSPLTTQGNGVFHFAFGAILGFAAHGRSKEKIASTEKTELLA